MYKIYIYTAVVSTSLALLVTSLKADESDICGAVLRGNVFNTYSSDYQSNIFESTGNKICNLRIYNRKELQSQSANLQSGGQYGMISGFFNADETRSGSSFENTYDKMCNKNDTSIVKDLFNSQRTQITSENILAWRECVVNKVGLFSSLQSSADNKTFTIIVHYKKPDIAPKKLQLKGISKMYGFNCVAANDMKIDDFFPEDNGLFGPFAITCERLSPNTNNTIAITTNVGPVGPFEVPSQQFSELSNKVQQLQMTEEQFRETQDQLRQSVAVLSGSFSALRASEKTCPQTSGDAVSCNAKCEATESVISGACGIPAGSTGSSSIQNFGLSPSTNEWHCLWRGTANQGKAVAFCLPKTSH